MSAKFVPLSSFIQSSFWTKLSEIKINVDKLDECERKIWGYYSNVAAAWSTQVLEVDSTSFNTEFVGRKGVLPCHGTIYNKNTIEQFKTCDKSALINAAGKHFLECLQNGTALDTPSIINFFLILSFCDLKKYHFYYWFAFPVPHDLNLVQTSNESVISAHFSSEQLKSLQNAYDSLSPFQQPYFLIYNAEICTLKSKMDQISLENFAEFYFAFADYKLQLAKSQLKNFVIFILFYWPFLAGKTLKFLKLNLTKKLVIDDECKIFEITLPELQTDVSELVGAWAGWEKNEKDKFGPRLSNMKATMDPQVLYEKSVDLNLKLMKWRLLPDVDLEKNRSVKCLLLGAGTLGCSVARTLIGWGVRNVTFVDNSTVSASNPVRQSLFTYEDYAQCRPKAVAAAEALKRIHPAINAQAVQLSIPMPGHSVGETQLKSTENDVHQLEELVRTHDVVFLLTDSRESRWLPTLLGVQARKMVLNVALGFDTYLIMRYGLNVGETAPAKPVPEGYKRISGTELGCYFCNDVTAPGDSMKDRTLDQQCTVTRPGVSSIAGALAVELAISLLQHESGAAAPAFYKMGRGADLQGDFDEQSLLGVLPHSIRGFLSSFSSVLPATPKYSQCIACSPLVLHEYESRGFGFLLDCFNGSKYLEDLTGLSQLLSEQNYADVLEIDSDDDF